MNSFREEVSLFLKMCLSIISFLIFQGKVQSSRLVDFVNVWRSCSFSHQRRQKLSRSIFFQKKLILLFGAMSSRIFNLLCVKINSSQKSLNCAKKVLKTRLRWNVTHTFSILFVSQKVFILWDFSKKNVFLRKVLSLISYFASFSDFHLWRIWNNKLSVFGLSFPSEKWVF